MSLFERIFVIPNLKKIGSLPYSVIGELRAHGKLLEEDLKDCRCAISGMPAGGDLMPKIADLVVLDADAEDYGGVPRHHTCEVQIPSGIFSDEIGTDRELEKLAHRIAKSIILAATSAAVSSRARDRVTVKIFNVRHIRPTPMFSGVLISTGIEYEQVVSFA
jgi:hypothetical protein